VPTVVTDTQNKYQAKKKNRADVQISISTVVVVAAVVAAVVVVAAAAAVVFVVLGKPSALENSSAIY